MTEYKAYKARVFIERPAADVEFEPVPDGAGCVICGRRFPIGAVPAARVAMALPELPIQSPVCRKCAKRDDAELIKVAVPHWQRVAVSMGILFEVIEGT